MTTERMSDERWRRLREWTWFKDAQAEITAELDRARAAETELRAENERLFSMLAREREERKVRAIALESALKEMANNDALRTLARRLRAWVDRDEVRLTTMAVNSPVWEELAEIDHEMCRLGVVEE